MVTLMLATLVAAAPAEPTGALAVAETELVTAARKHFRQRQYAEAIAKFQAAYELVKSPVRLYNIGKCHERLGDPGQALRFFREYLRLEPTAQQDDLLRGDIANAERRLKELGLQQVAVYFDPPTASVAVDGSRLPSSPAYVELKAGEHLLAAQAEGFAGDERRLNFPLPGSVSVEVSFVLKPLTDAPRTATATAPAPGQPRIASPPLEPPPMPVPEVEAGALPTAVTATAVAEPAPGGSKALGWVACGTGVLAVGLGAFAIAEGAIAKRAYDDAAGPLRVSPVQTNAGLDRYNQRITDGNAAATLGWIGAGGSGAALVVTGVLGFLSYRQTGEIGPFRF